MTAKVVPELFSSDIGRSLQFYTSLLGFAILYERPEERFAYLDRDGAQFMIEQPTDRSWLAGSMDYPFGRGINLQIEVADVDALCRAVQAAAHPVFLPMEDRWYRRGGEEVGNRQFIVLDPDGYMLRFFSPLGSRQRAALLME